ncbi:hypothetical protein [Psychrobacter vallis]|uniref:hypothetical protein n=1 Tax=Psychrobacter vallis TaxID=248451 RepID=UPI0019186AEB|nr:hypothetical protein [Psychrobacter vallis]
MSTLANDCKKHDKKTVAMSAALLLTVLSVTGCSTTPEFKPTASVMVGAQTSL